MTPEERAARLVGDMPWVTEKLTPKQIADLPKQIGTCITVAIAASQDECAERWPSEWIAAIRAAVAAEREACAKVAEMYYGHEPWAVTFGLAGETIAEAIRARGEAT